MALVIVKVQDSEVTRQYFADLEAKLRSPDAFQNPFKGHAKTYWRQKELLGVVKIEPIYPAIWYIGYVFFISYLLWGRWWLLPPTAFFLLISFLWSGTFYRLILWRGLRRKGYQGTIAQLSAGAAWGWLLGTD